MTQYYFIGTALPALTIGVKPELSFEEFLEMLKENLTQKDLQKVYDLLWTIDLANIRALWMGYPLDERGIYSPKELEEALLVRDDFPAYLNDFLDRYESTADRLRYFPSLYASFYREMIARESSGFLWQYFTVERDTRLILTALRAKQLGREVARELQFEDLNEALVQEILAQKDSIDYTPPSGYEELKTLFQQHLNNPKQLHRALLEYRFKQLEVDDQFSIDRILSYLVQLMIVESWEGLNQELGNAIVEDLSKHG